MNELINEGAIGPIKHLTTFDISQLETAMSFFSKSVHAGKLVITFQDPNATLKVLRPVVRASFDPQAAYLLVGCLGGLGRSLATWMVERGARYLFFFSRSGANKPEAASILKDLAEAGARPEAVGCDVTDEKALVLAVERIVTQMPVKGVIHAAMVEGVSSPSFQRRRRRRFTCNCCIEDTNREYRMHSLKTLPCPKFRRF